MRPGITLLLRCQGRVPLAWPLQQMPYGVREFALTDCKGYLLAFKA